MCSNSPEEDDYRPIMSSGPFIKQPGSITFFSFVSFYVEDVSHPCPSLDALLEADKMLEEYHENCFVIEREDKLSTSTKKISNTHSEIKIYPNPFSDQLFINSKDQIEKISIFKSTGQLVAEKKGDEISSNSIHTSLLSSGVYFVRINDAKQVNKIVKME